MKGSVLGILLRYGWLPASMVIATGALALTLQAAEPGAACPPVFADEFNGTRLDLEKWTPTYSSGRTELQAYVPDNLELGGGSLRLKAEPRPYEDYAYTSGAITTRGTHSQIYGYFEMRARVPSGQGLWPAFWLLHTGVLPWMEIDVMEVLGDEPTRLHLSHHWPDAQGELASRSVKYDGPDFSDGFHTYAVDWQPGQIKWYVDGVLRAEADEHVPAEPMFLLANLAVGGSWPGAPDETTEFPAYFEIDYIRAYAADCTPRFRPTEPPQ